MTLTAVQAALITYEQVHTYTDMEAAQNTKGRHANMNTLARMLVLCQPSLAPMFPCPWAWKAGSITPI